MIGRFGSDVGVVANDWEKYGSGKEEVCLSARNESREWQKEDLDSHPLRLSTRK